MVELTKLNYLESGEICSISDNLEIKRRLLDIGFTKGSKIMPILISPFNGPIAYKIKNTTIALRKNDALGILVKRCV